MISAGAAAGAAPLTVAVPVLAAALSLVLARHAPRRFMDALALACAAVVAALDAYLLAASSAGRLVDWVGGWHPVHGASVGVVLIVDPLGAGAALTAAALVAVGLVYSWRYFETAESHYQVLLLLFLAGMEGFALTGDVFDMFVFFELMGAAAYALTGFKVEDPSAVQGGLNFGIVNSLGAYVSLFGVGLLYSRTGQLSLPLLSRSLSGRPPDAFVGIAFVLIATGFLVKAAVVPFHFWLPDAHAVAPAPVCVLFSGIMVELGLYGVARLYWAAFSGAIPVADIHRAFTVLGLVTAVLGAALCVAQRHVKRLLAFSTISHVGLFCLAFGAGTPAGLAGAALYALGHAGVKAALFLLAGLWLNQYGSVDEIDLAGRGRAQRGLFALWVVAALALGALPPFGTALGHDVAESAAAAGGAAWAPAVFVVTSALCAGAVLRAAARVHLGWGARSRPAEGDAESPPGEEQTDVVQRLERAPWTMVAPIVVLLLGALAVGVVPQIAAGAAHAGERFVDRAGYVAQALRGAPAGRLGPLAGVGWSPLGTGLGLLTAVLAVAVAAAALWAPPLPEAARRALRPAGQAFDVVRRAHSGHVGDYVAWLLAGVAAVGALIVLPLR